VRTAVLAANNSDTVIITNGNYAETAEIPIQKSVTVKSVNGPTLTTVRRTGAGAFRVFAVSNSAAWLIGVTVSNGDLSSLQQHGAGVRLFSGFVSNCIVTKNISNRGVGGMYMDGGRCTHTTFRYNRDDGNYLTAGGVTIGGGVLSNCWIYGNNAMHASGVKLSGASAVMTRCSVSNNFRNVAEGSLSGDEYAVEVGNAGVIVDNCLIVNNSGRGIYMAGGRIRNCTISGNSTFKNTGNGIYMTGGSVSNCIVYFNTANTYVQAGHDIYKTAGTVAYSCMYPLLTGTGNISADPRFVKRASRNYRLLPGSPCLDAGATIATLSHDYEGIARPIDGDGTGGVQYDMGAYETETFGAGSFRCGYRASRHEGTNSIQVVFTAYVAGPDTTVTYCGWDFNNDGTMDIEGATRQIVTNTFGSGFHTIVLVASNSLFQTATLTMTNDIRVVSPVAYVKPSGAPVFPYDTWAKAATNLVTALTAATPLVVVTGGVHRMTGSVRVTRAVTIQGTNAANTVVSRNAAGGNFAVFYLNHAQAVAQGLTVSNGYTSISGGGIWMDSGTIRNCVIRNNGGNRTPGGIQMTTGLVENCIIRDNNDSGNYLDHAGGVEMANGTIRNCTFYGNRGGSHTEAAGAMVLGGGLVRNCVFTNNTFGTSVSGGKAGGIIINGGRLDNCLVAANTGRGIYQTAGTIRQCTVGGNSGLASYGSGTGHGIYMTAGFVTNCVVYHNGSATYLSDNSNLARSGGTASYSCAPELTNGTGNITTDPRFASASTRNYALRPGSPCIDSGANVATITNDLPGTTRPLDGNGVGGATHDMGCYEAATYNAGTFRCGFTCSTYEGFGSIQVVFTSYVAGTNTTITWYGWDFNNDGTQELQGPSFSVVTNTFGIGTHTIRLTVTNSIGQGAQAIQVNDVRIKSDTAYVKIGGGHISPYETWAKAATNLQAALDSGATTIYVTNGNHKVAAEIALSRKLTIRSINGPSVTTVARTGGSSFNVFYMNHAESVLDGVTVTNGFRGRNSSGGICMAAGTVRNCVIWKNEGNRGPGGLYITGGLLTNCTVRNNIDTGNYLAHAGGIEMTAGTVKNCTLYGNRGGSHSEAGGALCMSGGTVANCVMTNNTYGTASSGGMAGGVIIGGGALDNCLIAANIGRGVYMSGGTIRNCTVGGNSGAASYSDGAGKGICMTAGFVTNSVVYHNGSAMFLKDNSNLLKTGGTVSFSCAPELTNGTSNTTNDPRFVSVSTRNYSLRPGSPCIDTGTNLSTIAADMAGTGRPLDGDGAGGARHDMGCYEAATYNTGILRCGFTCSVYEGVGSVQVVFTSFVAGNNRTITYYGWDFNNDGTRELQGSSLSVVTNTFTTGSHTITLTVSNSAVETAQATQANDVRIGSDTSYVRIGGGHISPYDTWAKAATNLASALGSGATLILVSNGTHRVTAEVAITRQLTIRSVNGAAVTTIARNAAGGNFSLFYMNHSAAVLDGLTVSNGAYGRSAVGGIVLTSGTVKNSVIRNNQAGRSAGGIYITGGVVSNCVIRNNLDPDNSTTCGGVVMSGGLLTYSRIERNKGGSDATAIGGLKLSGGTVQYSIIASNEAGTSVNSLIGGARLSAGTIRNCLVYGNQCPTNGSVGGIYIEGGILESSVLTGNKGGTGAGGLNAAGGGITNCVVWANQKYGTTNDVGGTLGLCKYSCAPELTGGANYNISQNPQFETPGSGYGLAHVLGDYRIKVTSPCVNKGITKSWMISARDLADKPRLDGNAPDMGAYEVRLSKGAIFTFL